MNDQNTLAMKIYPARLTIDRPETLDRVTTLLRFLWIIPIGVILTLVSGDRSTAVTISETGERVRTGGTSIVFSILLVGVVVAVVIAWIAILIGGRYPRSLFDYVVGVGRWFLRVQAYAIYLVTDRYPPFSLS